MENMCVPRKSVFCTKANGYVWTTSQLANRRKVWYSLDTKKNTQAKQKARKQKGVFKGEAFYNSDHINFVRKRK